MTANTTSYPGAFFVKRILYLIQCVYIDQYQSLRARRSSPRSPARSQTLVLIYIYNTELSIIFSLQKKRLGKRLQQISKFAFCTTIFCIFAKRFGNFHNQQRVVIDSWREINSGKIQRSAKNWLRRETQGKFVDNAYLDLCFNAL